MKYAVKNLNNEEVGSIDLEPSIFALPVRPDILARVIRWQLALRQSGTHKTKGISEISGTTKKPHRQKGTGRARQGSLRSPQFRGGATIFGPVVRSHAHKLNKKFRKLAVKTALSTKYQESRICVLDSFDKSVYKTSSFAKAFQSMGMNSALIITSAAECDQVVRYARNVKGLDALPAHAANVYDILRKETLVISRQGLEELVGRLK
jgi:large subunit ribosomal protein L4